MMTFLLFVLVFGVVVIAHEFGHFLIAKVNGIAVEEFSVGMGPVLFAIKGKKTRYTLRLLPIGGACMFMGEDGLKNEEEELTELPEGSFQKANVWARIATVVAGPFFNMILAFVVALIMVQMIAIREPIASVVIEDSAAAQAGLVDGDRLLSINGERIYLYEEIPLCVELSRGKELAVVYEREGEKFTTTIVPKYDAEYGRYMLGIQNKDFASPKGFSYMKYAWYEVRYGLVNTYKSLGMLVTGKITRKDVAGPVGIAVNVVGKVYEETKESPMTVFVNMLNIVMLLSVNLGVLNLLPFPALDGGRLVFLLLEVLRGKPVAPKYEGMVHLAGLVFFFGLMIFVFFNDLVNIFG